MFGGLLGEAIVMPVSRYQPDGFIALGGRIPAPVISLRNQPSAQAQTDGVKQAAAGRRGVKHRQTAQRSR